MSGTETLWQELICRLEGVQAAQVVFAESGMPCEIHVPGDGAFPRPLLRQ